MMQKFIAVQITEGLQMNERALRQRNVQKDGLKKKPKKKKQMLQKRLVNQKSKGALYDALK